MSPFPERIATRRLLLRPWESADAPALRAAIDESLPQLQEWLPWAMAEPSAVEDLAQRLQCFREAFQSGRDWAFAVFDLAGGSLLGAGGLHPRRGPGVLEIGYWLRSEAVGNGFATEVVEALTRAAFEHGGVGRVEIRCDPRNVRSIAVARRAGFRHLETLEGDAVTPAGAPRDTTVWLRSAPGRHFAEPDGPAAGGG